MADTTLVIAPLFFVSASPSAAFALSPVVVETLECPLCHSEINGFDCDTMKVNWRTKFYCPVCEVEMREVYR